MAKTKLAIEDLDSCTIEDTNNLEMMRPSDSEKPPYAARVGKIEADHENNMKLLVRLYYRLVDSVGEQGYSRPVATSV